MRLVLLPACRMLPVWERKVQGFLHWRALSCPARCGRGAKSRFAHALWWLDVGKPNDMAAEEMYARVPDTNFGTLHRGANGGIFPVYRLMLLPAALTVMTANVLARLDVRPSAAVQLGLWLLVVACLVLGMHVRPLAEARMCMSRISDTDTHVLRASVIHPVQVHGLQVARAVSKHMMC